MSGDVTRDHYDRLAATFDENWAYSAAFVEWMTGCIQRRLQIGDGEVAADIGCGTGLYSHGLAEHAQTVVCVDASQAMLEQLPVSEQLIPVNAAVEDVAAGRAALPQARYDAMLLKEVLHHVEDPAAVIGGLARMLKPGGRMLVVMLPTRISYPLFTEALRRFSEGQPDPVGMADAMHAAGLQAELTYESYPLTFATERYLDMVRNRYMSLLAQFSDEQLEAGVGEIRRANPGDEISFTDTFAFVLGTAA